MKAQTLEYLAEAAKQLAPYRPEAGEHLLALSAEVASEAEAMRMPITPDTLEADGWKLERYSAGVYSKTVSEVTVRLDAIAKMFAFGRGSFLWVKIFATSIHDLRLLERLIGGAQ